MKKRCPLRDALSEAIRSRDAHLIQAAADAVVALEMSRVIIETLKFQAMVTAQRSALKWAANEGLIRSDDLPGAKELLAQNHLPGAYGATEPEELRARWAAHSEIAAWNGFREKLRRDPSALPPW